MRVTTLISMIKDKLFPVPDPSQAADVMIESLNLMRQMKMRNDIANLMAVRASLVTEFPEYADTMNTIIGELRSSYVEHLIINSPDAASDTDSASTMLSSDIVMCGDDNHGAPTSDATHENNDDSSDSADAENAPATRADIVDLSSRITSMFLVSQIITVSCFLGLSVGVMSIAPMIDRHFGSFF